METTIFGNNNDSIEEKSYRKENLLWEWELSLERCNFIEKSSVKFDFIPKVNFLNIANLDYGGSISQIDTKNSESVSSSLQNCSLLISVFLNSSSLISPAFAMPVNS